LIDQIRSFLQDSGLNAPAGPIRLGQALPGDLDADERRLSAAMRKLLGMLREQWRAIDAEAAGLEEELHGIARADAACSRLATIPGVGLITATAIVAAVATEERSARAETSRPGSASCHDSTPQAAGRRCPASASAETATSGRC
jgi:transposase